MESTQLGTSQAPKYLQAESRIALQKVALTSYSLQASIASTGI
jgi:hypothetical protein